MRQFDPKIVDLILSAQGNAAIEKAKGLNLKSVSEIARFKESVPKELASAVIELLKTREKAKTKFTLADKMLFDPEGYEQSSPEIISTYKADHIRNKVGNTTVLDLCCGIGADTIGLAKKGKVIAIDCNLARIKMARHNAKVYNVEHNIQFVCADIKDIIDDKSLPYAIHIDPDQRKDKRRSKDLKDISPSIEYISRIINNTTIGVAVKLSPAMDINSIPWQGQIEIISLDGECKQMIIWTGGFYTTGRKATILPHRVSIDDRIPPSYDVRDICSFIYEPDPAVSRLKLIPNLAGLLKLSFLAPGQVLLTSEEYIKSPFVKSYRVLELMPHRLDNLKKYFKSRKAIVSIKPKGVKIDTDKLSRLLSTAKSKETLYCFIARLEKKLIAIIAEKV